MHQWSDFSIEPDLTKHGHHYMWCPVCTKDRRKDKLKSLGVNQENNSWGCTHCGFAGSLYKGVTNPGGIHLKKGDIRSIKAKEYTKPQFVEKSEYPDAVLSFFTDRGISEKTIKLNKVGFCKTKFAMHGEEMQPAIQFPFYKNDEVVNIKFRGPEKAFKQSYNAEKVVYGFDDIVKHMDSFNTKKEFIIVEGEMDKMSWNEIGFWNVCSVPDGAPAPNAKDYTTKFDFLESLVPMIELAQRVILAVDDDAAGETLREELARRIGKEKCFLVTYPVGIKDSNDVLQNAGKDGLKKIYDTAYQYPISGIFTVVDVQDKLDRVFLEGITPGFELSWPAMKDLYRPPLGEFTTVTGVPGSGKSEIIDCITLDLANNHKQRVGIFSPEHPIHIHMLRLIEKYVNKPIYIRYLGTERFADLKTGSDLFMNRDEFMEGKKFLNEWFFFIAPDRREGKLTLKILQEKKQSLIRRYGCSVFIDDPYNKMENSRPPGMSETDYISEFLDMYQDFNKDNHTHSFLVAHPALKGIKKVPMKVGGQKVEVWPIITPADISGSSNWWHKSLNCMSIYRSGMNLGTDAGKEEPTKVIMQKVKFKWNGKLGSANLYFNEKTGNYTDALIPSGPHESSTPPEETMQHFETRFQDQAIKF